MEDVLCVSYGRNHLCHFFIFHYRIVKQEIDMTWIKIDRDENGFATEECLDRLFSNLPCVVAINSYGMDIYKVIPEWDKQTRDFLKSKAIYTHYLIIPKLEV